LGINTSILASSLAMVVAQRLLRKICPHCSTKSIPTAEEKDIFVRNGIKLPTEIPKPVGCESCKNSGYIGRTGIYEVLLVDRAMEELIAAGATHSAIEDTAVKSGTCLMFKQALKKVYRQITSLEEVFRVVANA
jgi:type IV pilus assembly protein PilB